VAAVASLFASPAGAFAQEQEIVRVPASSADFLNSGLLRISERGAADPQVTIVEFTDFACPFCAHSASGLRDLLREYPNKVRLILKHDPLNIHPNAALLHEAALAAGEQGKFWEMHDLLFARQGKLGMTELVQMAQELNLDVPRFQQAVEQERYKEIIAHDRSEASAFGVHGTPTFYINGHRISGYESFENLKRVVEQLSGDPVSHPGLATVRTTDFKLKDAPVRGSSKAPITVVEFSDMQCPFCAREAGVLREALANYPGQVQWVFKNFPLSFHPNSPLAHEAVMAAGAQGKFWEMHDLIFANQKSMARGDLDGFARQIGLDMQRFDSDLDASKYRDHIQADQDEGDRLNVTGTPTVFINGRRLVGAQQLTELVRLIADELKIAPPSNVMTGDSRVKPALRLGGDEAPVTITWYADLDSPLSAQAEELVLSAFREHSADVQVAFRNRPLAMYPGSEMVHEAAMAAAAQGKFWEMERLLVARRAPAVRADLLQYAAQVGLNVEDFVRALDERRYRSQVSDDLLEAQRLDVRGSPTFFVNATRVDGIPAPARFQELVQEEISRSRPGHQPVASGGSGY